MKIVCSTSNPDNQRKIDKRLGTEYQIEQPLDPVKKINFYTSACFEGCDIYDTNGKVFIVSDRNKRHTQVDVSTLLIQICGRIRNTEYKKITHIFSYTKYSGGISLEEFEEKVLKDYSESQETVEEINALGDKARAKTLKGFSDYYCNDNYFTKKDNKLYIDENLLNIDIVNFKIATGIYSSRVAYIEELEKNGLEYENDKYDFYHKSAEDLKENNKAKLSFKDVFEDYIKLQANKSGFDILNKEIHVIDRERPLVGEAYSKLGVDRVRELKYHVGNIRREIIKVSDKPLGKKIMEMIADKIGFHKEIIAKDSENIVKEIYSSLGINKAVKSTVIDKYFDVKRSVKKIDGMSVNYIEIVREKLIFD